MRVLVCYDVEVTSAGGARRLRRVAQACQNFGQRVQLSVFECVVTAAGYEELKRALLAEIDVSLDNLRLYRLPDRATDQKEVFGRDREVDFTGPLVV
jgi:CRISPR-associated protein Cas2